MLLSNQLCEVERHKVKCQEVEQVEVILGVAVSCQGEHPTNKLHSQMEQHSFFFANISIVSYYVKGLWLCSH